MLYDMPIRTKLLGLMALTAMLALTLAISAVIVNEKIVAQRTVAEELRSMADMLAFNSSAALAFDDRRSAKAVLASLKASSDVAAGFLYDVDGKLFARFLRPDSKAAPGDGLHDPDGLEDSFTEDDVIARVLHDQPFIPLMIDGRLHIVRPVRLDDEIIGAVHLVDDLRRLERRVSSFYTMSTIIFIVTLLLIFLLSTKLQRLFTRPMEQIIDSMETVCSEKNYRVRIKGLGKDEFGVLADRFNEMISKINDRDLALAEHNATLESTVALRTEKLRLSNRELASTVKHLEKTRGELEQATEAERTFLANMSHEFKTPMNSILGMLDLTLETPLDSDQDNYLRTAKGSADNLMLLLNNILDYFKLETGQLEVLSMPCNLKHLFAVVMKAHAVAAEHKGLVLEVSMAPELPECITGDELRLSQVLVHLIDNSIKFTAKGEIRVTVTVNSESNPDRMRLNIAVSDTGEGIPHFRQESIFDRFQRQDNLGVVDGAGLGLSISRGLVELMGGTIRLESTEGKGTVFFIDLPLRPCLPETVVEKAKANTPASHHDGLVVLVVEDNVANQYLARVLLGNAGYQVVLAENGAKGVEALLVNDIDVVIMDVRMPVMNGVEATETIRAIERGQPAPYDLPDDLTDDLARRLALKLANGHIPIIAMTAHDMVADKQSCMTAGMDYYLTKPFQMNQIESVFATIFQHPSISS